VSDDDSLEEPDDDELDECDDELDECEDELEELDDDEELLEAPDTEPLCPYRPSCAEQAGHAPQPWLASTFSAIAIWVDLLAFAGLPEPPKPCQVLRLNCRPP
jgi:hypothetical protein